MAISCNSKILFSNFCSFSYLVELREPHTEKQHFEWGSTILTHRVSYKMLWKVILNLFQKAECTRNLLYDSICMPFPSYVPNHLNSQAFGHSFYCLYLAVPYYLLYIIT